MRAPLYYLTTGTWTFNDPVVRLDDVTAGTFLMRLAIDFDGGAPAALTDASGQPIFYPARPDAGM